MSNSDRIIVTSKNVGAGRYYYEIVDGRRKRISRRVFFTLLNRNAMEVGYLDSQKYVEGANK